MTYHDNDRADIIDAKARLPMTALLDDLTPDWRRRNPIRPDDKKNSFSANNLGWKDHGTGDTGDQIRFIERLYQADTGEAIRRFLDMANGAPPAKTSQKRPVTIDWPTCVRSLDDRKIREVAKARGYSIAIVDFLKEKGLIGIYHDCVAFPIHEPDGKVTGVHYKIADGSFRTVGKMKPLIIGSRNAKKWLVLESQWDAFAMMEELCFLLPEYEPAFTILITRGATNGKFASIIPADAKVWAVMQNDAPKPDGAIPSEKWLADVVAASPAPILVARVPASHKDANDWLRACDSQFTVMISEAVPAAKQGGSVEVAEVPLTQAEEPTVTSTFSTPPPRHADSRPESAPVQESHVECVMPPQEEAPQAAAASAFSTAPPRAVWPADSYLERYVQFARTQTESEDAIIIGSILPVVSRLLGRRVYVRFGLPKYTNLFNLLVTKPGLRKSTTIRLAEALAKAILPPNALIGGATSEQALFDSYLAECDRLWIEDEGNTLISNWSSDAAGKQVSKRMLSLYDCKDWRQNYIRHKEEGGGAEKYIPQTSTSMIVGITLNNSRFEGVENRDGLRRRVSYYLSKQNARQIDWPLPIDQGEFEALLSGFRRLLSLEGEISLSAEAALAWGKIQTDNRRAILDVTDIDHASEAHASMLSDSPTKILKRAAIFEICRYLENDTRDWTRIQPDTLELAAEHESYCVAANRQLDTVGMRAEIRDKAESVLAQVRTKNAAVGGWIRLSKSKLTTTFASNPSRYSAMTVHRLYNEIIPDLIQRDLARLDIKSGKLHVYAFRAEEAN